MLHSHSYCSKQKNVITSKVCFCIQDSRLYGRYDETGKVWWRIIAIFARVLSIMRWESCSAGGEWEVCTLARSVCRQNTKWFVGIFDVLGYFLVHFLGILSVLPQHDLGFCLDHLQEEKCLFWMWSCSVVLFCLQNFWLVWMVSGVWTISTRFGIWSRSSCHDLGLFPNHQMVPRRPKGPQTRSWGPEGPLNF